MSLFLFVNKMNKVLVKYNEYSPFSVLKKGGL